MLVTIAPHKMPKINADTLYHITELKYWPDIQVNGLVLKSKTPGMLYPKRVYFYTDLNMALARLEMARIIANKKLEEPILLRINNLDNKYAVRLDPEAFMGMGVDQNDLDAGRVPVYASRKIVASDIQKIR